MRVYISYFTDQNSMKALVKLCVLNEYSMLSETLRTLWVRAARLSALSELAIRRLSRTQFFLYENWDEQSHVCCYLKAGRWKEALSAFSTAVVFAPQSEEGVGKDLSLALANR